MSKKKQKCYIYMRVSTAMQVEGYSLEAQKERLNKFADFQNLEVVREYCMQVNLVRILQEDLNLHRCFKMLRRLYLLFAKRVQMLRKANPDMEETAIPVELVTWSGSGLDPHISPAAAKYQVTRIAKANNMSEEKVGAIIEKCTDSRFLGVFGEKTVNVLKVNLMLDGIL